MSIGMLAMRYSGREMPLCVIEEFDGFAVGTRIDADGPRYTRESEEVFPTAEQASMAIQSGRWTQRLD